MADQQLTTKQVLIEEIFLHLKANEVPGIDEIWLALIFRSESELKAICTELGIKH